MLKKSVSPSGERTFTFVFLYSFIMAATVSLGRSYARGICSIFSLCMESNASEKSTSKCRLKVFLREILLEFDVLSEFVKLWIDFSENHFDSS